MCAPIDAQALFHRVTPVPDEHVVARQPIFPLRLERVHALHHLSLMSMKLWSLADLAGPLSLGLAPVIQAPKLGASNHAP
jgi:hypothetical protein